LVFKSRGKIKTAVGMREKKIAHNV
jgi:hypothetical protein